MGPAASSLKYTYLTNNEETEPASGSMKISVAKGASEFLTNAPITDTLKHAVMPSGVFTMLPWSTGTGTWTEASGWEPGGYTAGFLAGSRSGLYWSYEKLKGNVAVGIKRTTGSIVSLRQFGVWLFTEAGAQPSGYQLAVISETSTVQYVLRKWVDGTATVLSEVKGVPLLEGDSVYLAALDGKVSMWRRAGEGTPTLVGAEVADSTFTEGYAGFDANGTGSNYKLVNFSAGPLVGSTNLAINETDGDATPISPYLATWDDSTSNVRGFVMLKKVGAPDTFALYKVVAGLVDKGNWDKLPVEPVASSGTFTDKDKLTVDFYRNGDKGAPGATGEKGATGATGATGSTGEKGAGAGDAKESVVACTTTNVDIKTALNVGDVVDGVTLVAGDRVLVANQTTKLENGIWSTAASPSRTTDANAAEELSGGSMVLVERGTKYGGRQMKITTPGSISPGTTPHDWAPLGPKDFGVVTTLPTAGAIVGDRATFKATAAGTDATVYWDLLYDGEGERPWVYMGGSPLSARVDTQATLNNTTTYTALPTEPISVTLPNVKGDWDIKIEGMPVGVSPTAGLTAGRLSYAVGATPAADAWGVSTYYENEKEGMRSSVDGSKQTRWFGVPASTKVEEQGRTDGNYEIAFVRRRIWIQPVRLG
jgi:hypothetical protein